MLFEKLTYKSFVKMLLYIYVLYKLIYPAFVRYFSLPQLPTLFFEVILTAVLIFTFLLVKIRSGKLVQNSYVSFLRYFILLLLVIVAVSAINSSNNFFIVAKSLLGYFLPVLILFNLILEINLTEDEQTNFIKYVFALIFVQIPVTLYQAIIISPSNADSNSGTMSYAELGGTGILSILEGFLLAIFIMAFLLKDFEWKYLLLALLTLIPSIMGGSRFGLLVTPLIIFISIIVYFSYFNEVARKQFFKISLNTAVVAALLSVIFIFVIPNTKYAEFLNLEIASSINNFISYDESAGRYSRSAGYYILFDNYFSDEFEYIAGLGPGSIITSETVDESSSVLESITNLPDAVMIIASLGLSGFALIIAFVLSPLLIMRKYLNMEPNPFMKIIGSAIVPISILVLLGLFYAPTWNSQVGIVYWAILGVLVDRYRVFTVINQYSPQLSYISHYKEDKLINR